jgi:hypothetical protein
MLKAGPGKRYLLNDTTVMEASDGTPNTTTGTTNNNFFI